MSRLTLAVALVAVATLAAAGAASAGPIVINKNFLKYYGKSAPTEVTSPGDAFYPQTANVDPREECLAAGGTPKRAFDGTEFVWTCRQ
jgi:hypothetical protein